MHILTALQALVLLFAPVTPQVDADVEPVDFQVQVYPYRGYYSYPPYCPPGYGYGPGVGYRNRGFSFYFGPGYRRYPGCYYYGRRYYSYPRYYYRHGGKHHNRRHHKR